MTERTKEFNNLMNMHGGVGIYYGTERALCAYHGVKNKDECFLIKDFDNLDELPEAEYNKLKQDFIKFIEMH